MPRFPAASPAAAGLAGNVYSQVTHRLAQVKGETYPLHVGDTWRSPAPGCRMEDQTLAAHPDLHRYGPVQGLPALIDAVLDRVATTQGLPCQRDEILITAGATGGLFAVCAALLSPGDEVLILAPYWPLIAGIVRAVGGVPVPVPCLGPHDGPASPEALAAAVRAALTDRTVALYLNTPHNPTGRILPAPTLERLAAFARRHDLWLLADEVYALYHFGGGHTFTRPLAPERTFSCHSFSKAYGMAGNRCGYLVGPAAVIAAARNVATHTWYATPTASQRAALAALAGPGDAWAAAAAADYAAVGARAAARLGIPPPEGSTFLFLDVAAALDDRGLRGLLEDCADQGLLVGPGPSFGPAYGTCLRLCYTSVPPDQALRGVEILARRLGR